MNAAKWYIRRNNLCRTVRFQSIRCFLVSSFALMADALANCQTYRVALNEQEKKRITKEENTLTNGILSEVYKPNNTVAYWFRVQAFVISNGSMSSISFSCTCLQHGSRMIFLQKTKVRSGQSWIKCNKICRSSRPSRKLETSTFRMICHVPIIFGRRTTSMVYLENPSRSVVRIDHAKWEVLRNGRFNCVQVNPVHSNVEYFLCKKNRKLERDERQNWTFLLIRRTCPCWLCIECNHCFASEVIYSGDFCSCLYFAICAREFNLVST